MCHVTLFGITFSTFCYLHVLWCFLVVVCFCVLLFIFTKSYWYEDGECGIIERHGYLKLLTVRTNILVTVCPLSDHYLDEYDVCDFNPR